MLVVCQFPISDARVFLPQTGRLVVPHWRDPQPREFVRGFGSVKQRRKGGHAQFADEAYFASARQAIRIPELERAALVAGRSGARCAFRRLYCDGRALARVEVGLRVSTSRKADSASADGSPPSAGLTSDEVDELISSVLALPVRVHCLGAGTKSLALHVCGATLASLYARATSRKGTADSPGVVRSVTPTVLITYRPGEIETLPPDAQTIDTKMTGGVTLSYFRRERGDQVVGVWLLREGDVKAVTERNLRVALLRVHAEYQSLRHVLALLLDGAIVYKQGTEEGERLQEHLNRAATMLPESYPGAAPEKAIAEVLHTYDQPVSTDQRALIAEALAQARRQITKKLDKYLATGEQAKVNAAPEARPINVFVSYSHRDDTYVKDDSERSILVFMAGLKREGFIFWHDRELYASEIWDDRIKQEMTQADIALLLVSQNFLNSGYITSTEMPTLLTSRAKSGLALVPLMLSACDWESYPWLAAVQHLPRKGTLAKEYRTRAKRDELYLEVFQTIRRIGAEKRT